MEIPPILIKAYDYLRVEVRHLRDDPEIRDFFRRWRKELGVVCALLLILAAPFVLKPAVNSVPSKYDRRLVIITPHNENICREYGQAFTKHWKEKTGEILYIDWRVPGGTSELSMFLRSEYAAAFQQYWTHGMGRSWSQQVASAFTNAKLNIDPDKGGALSEEQEARALFMKNDIGVGIDLFFGGGAYDFEQQARSGFLVSSDISGKHGLTSIFKKHPEWFQEDVIPQSCSGETFYDKDKRWVGTCLSSMGICYNRDVLRRLGIEKQPGSWMDLADPKYIRQIALSDPNKSGSVAKSFEQLIQQQISLAMAEVKKTPKPFQTEKDLVDEGLRLGWDNGLTLIMRISANTRYFTDAAPKIPLEVSQGDAAAGMSIDFYGRSFEDQVRKPDGSSRMAFVTPVGGTSFGVDPIGMLRGAPEPAVATAFMEFVLSEEGQKLWNFQVGAPGGPTQTALRRLPVRKDFYTKENLALMTDGTVDPYEAAKAFTYHPEWTSHLLGVIRFLVKAMCVESHDEQRRAWEMLAHTGFPQRATTIFEDTRMINYNTAQEIALLLNKKDNAQVMKKARELGIAFRNQYNRAYELAKDGL